MPLTPRIALSFVALSLAGSASRAEEPLFYGWGVTHYEAPAPAPAATPAVSSAPPKAADPVRRPAHERAARAHRHGPDETVVAREASPAPTPAAQPPVAVPGPIEQEAPTIHDLVTKHARANGVPANLAAAVVNIESRFNPRARGGSALGLMQIKYNTARSMGYMGGITDLMAPETNLHFGMKVLADAYKASHGDVCMTLARYQSGHLTRRASAANRAYCAKAKTFMAKTYVAKS